MEVGIYPSRRSTGAMPDPYNQQSVNPNPPPKYNEYIQPRNDPYTQQRTDLHPQQGDRIYTQNRDGSYTQQTYDPNMQPRYNANSTALQGYEHPRSAPERYTTQSDAPHENFPREYIPQRRATQGYYVSEGSGGLLGIRGRRHDRRRARRDGRQGRGFGIIGGIREMIADGLSNARSGGNANASRDGDERSQRYPNN